MPTDHLSDAISPSRRNLLLIFAGLAAGITAPSAAATPRSPEAMPPEASSAPRSGAAFVEHRIARGNDRLFAREYRGAGPAFVMLHGFPDNLHIYDNLAPLLAAAGRRVIAFDFLGFGESDKPGGYAYSFERQKGDLLAVVESLGIEKFIPVAHDAGGPAAINFALSHPKRVESLALLNTFYGDAPSLRFPELIELFADPELKSLTQAIISDPAQLRWLLEFQNRHFVSNATPALRERFDTILQPIINENFAAKPGAGAAFARMTGDLHASVASNDKRIAKLKDIAVPVNLIWGAGDPYLNRGVADDLASRFRRASVRPLAAGHWPQIDLPDEVARLLLAGA